MANSKLYHDLKDTQRYFINRQTNADTSDGWKLSIQGKTIQDAMYLYDNLKYLLSALNLPFKVGTQKLIDKNTEQSTKLMTIYIQNGYSVYTIAEMFYNKIANYKGWYDIKTPTSYEHYAGAIFIRNDRNNKGNYIPAK